MRYLVVDTGSWLTDRKVLISPKWIKRISFDESKIFVDLSRNKIKQSPEYTENSLINKDYETRLHQYYRREGYWTEGKVNQTKKPTLFFTSKESEGYWDKMY